MTRPRRGRQVFAEINITPLTDVCLVLLVIFMVTATVLTQTGGLEVAAPKASAAEQLPAKSVEFMVMKDGTIYLDSQSVTKSQLTEALRTKLSQTSAKTVVIKADADVPYHHVVAVMDAASALGAEITLAAELQQALQRQQQRGQ